MSNVSEENVSKLKIRACDKLLEARVDQKLTAGRVKDDVMSRITVAVPKPRDGAVREAFIPQSVQSIKDGDGLVVAPKTSTNASNRQTEKNLQWEHGGPGVYACDYRKYYQLDDDEWKFDTIPQILDGKNVLDFFDADIEEKLKLLDEEEAQVRLGEYMYRCMKAFA